MESNPNIKTWTPATIVMVALIIVGTVVAVYRMVFGLGATTNLNDGYPWGFWLGMDVLGGIAMAAGGFQTLFPCLSGACRVSQRQMSLAQQLPRC